jgi:hypothetical protein
MSEPNLTEPGSALSAEAYPKAQLFPRPDWSGSITISSAEIHGCEAIPPIPFDSLSTITLPMCIAPKARKPGRPFKRCTGDLAG